MKLMSSFAISAILLIHSSITVQSSSCISPTGIDDGSGITTSDVENLLDGTTLGSPLPALWAPLAPALIEELVTTYETPIQFRQAMYHGSNVYNVVAMYQTSSLDIWGRDDNRICTSSFASVAQQNAHEQVATAYAFAYSSITFAPGSEDAIVDTMENVLSLPMSNLDSNPPTSTPWGLAKVLIDEMFEFSKSDGWNADGSLTHQFNKTPFSDFDFGTYSKYEVKRRKRKNDCKKEWNWQPLLESNNAGYFTKQEHVTPFAGYTGRLHGLTKSEYEDFTVAIPKYNYCEVVDEPLEATRDLATDDQKKAEVEAYDSKFTSLLPMQIEWSFANGFSNFDFWLYDMILVTAMYDATMLVWREKILFDAVRPTTVVHELKAEEEVFTYAGPFLSPQNIPGKDWQPYIRTMPHAEYPSASSCICTSYAETLQLLTGQDSTGASTPLTLTIPAGSSKVEPGVVPANDITLTYTKWSEVAEVCGISRHNGGMHFSKAIPAGNELCTGIAELVISRANDLKNGDSEGAMVDINDTSIVVKESFSVRNMFITKAGANYLWFFNASIFESPYRSSKSSKSQKSAKSTKKKAKSASDEL